MQPSPEEYAKILQKTYEDAIAVAESIQAAAMADREAAAEELAAAKETRKVMEAHAEHYMEQHRTQLIEDTKKELLKDLVKKHLNKGKSPVEIMEWLHVSASFVEQQHIEIKMQKTPRPTHAHLEYSQSGRGGTITYQKEETILHFDWEFGGANCVVIIFVPDELQWEKATGLPVSERLEVLDFVARQVIKDQASGCRYEISDHWINILSA